MLTRYSKYLAFLAGLLLVVMFAVADRYISHHPSLILFYVIPVTLVTWFSGTIAGVFIALCSVIFWLSRDSTITKSLYAYPIFFYINMTARATFLFIMVYILQRLKTAIKHEKELNELKSVFVANVSHELRNPLAIIKESLSVILNGLVGDISHEQRDIIQTGKINIERLVRLVTDLLDLSKIEAGRWS